MLPYIFNFYNYGEIPDFVKHSYIELSRIRVEQLKNENTTVKTNFEELKTLLNKFFNDPKCTIVTISSYLKKSKKILGCFAVIKYEDHISIEEFQVQPRDLYLKLCIPAIEQVRDKFPELPYHGVINKNNKLACDALLKVGCKFGKVKDYEEFKNYKEEDGWMGVTI